MEVLADLIVVIILQYIHVSNHQIVHFKYLTTLFINFTSTKLRWGNILWKAHIYEHKKTDIMQIMYLDLVKLLDNIHQQLHAILMKRCL